MTTTPATPPPPERWRPVRYRGRTRQPRQRLTKQLVRAGHLDAVETGYWNPNPPRKDNPMPTTTIRPELPTRPTEGPWAEADQACTAIAAAQAAARAELADLDNRRSELISQLVADALDGRPLDLDLAGHAHRRLVVESTLDMLSAAWNRCSQERARRAATDPAVAEWRAECNRIRAQAETDRRIASILAGEPQPEVIEMDYIDAATKNAADSQLRYVSAAEMRERYAR